MCLAKVWLTPEMIMIALANSGNDNVYQPPGKYVAMTRENSSSWIEDYGAESLLGIVSTVVPCIHSCVIDVRLYGRINKY